MKSLAVPLLPAYLAAAESLHDEYMPVWRAMETALHGMRERLTDWDSSTTRFKAEVVNQLYSAGLQDRDLPRMAEHVAQIIERVSHFDIGLVEQFAALPSQSGPGIGRKIVFAAKFAHFFIDPTTYPIYDKYARRTLTYHLNGMEADADMAYENYVQSLEDLKQRAGLTCSYTELDHYLWLSGEYRAWLKDQNIRIYWEARYLFKHPPPGAKAALTLLQPSEWNKHPL